MRRGLSLFLIFTLIIQVFSGIGFSLDPDFGISGITLTKNFNGIDPNPFEYTLLIQGNKLQGTKVTYLNDMNQVQEVSNVEYEDDYIIQYSLGSEFDANEIFITNDTYRMTVQLENILSDMPTLNNLTPKKINQYVPGVSTGEEGKIYVDIANYETFKNSGLFSMFSFGTDIKTQVVDTDKKWFYATGEPGFQNVEFQKQIADADGSIVGNQPVKIRYNYRDAYKITTEVNMSDTVSVFPNRGAIGSTVTFKAPNLPNKVDASVFFVLKTGDPYKQAFKGTEAYYEKDVDIAGNDIFTVKVPAALTAGEEYFIVFTNFVADGLDPEKVVLRETILDKKFFVISEGSGTTILDFTPKSGSDIGSEIEITGKYFLTLNIDKLLINEGQVGYPKLSIDSNTDKLIIEYGDGTLKGVPVYDVKKEVTFYLNNTEEILSKSLDISHFTRDSDVVYIKTKEFLLGEAFKDVTIQARTTTSFHEGVITGPLVEYSEFAEKGNYRFISSTIKPEITAFHPPMVMVKNIGGIYQTIEDSTVNILGDNFIVHNFTVSTPTGSQEYTVYPKVEIADAMFDKYNDQIIVNGVTINGMTMHVYNERGEEVNGAPGNEVGTRIELVIPKGLAVPSALVSIGTSKPDVPVRVTNPKRNSLADGLSEDTTMRYVVVADSEMPVVTSFTPTKVNVDGKQDITVVGSNFKPGIKAYVRGQLVNVNRTDSEHLVVDVPAGVIGQAMLQLLNEDGGLTWFYFDYIDPYTRPEIVSIVPDEGENGTLSVITATRIFRPDPKGSYLTPLGRSLLLGTRVYLENIEVNTYRSGIDVLNDTDPIPLYNSYEPLLQITDGKLVLAEDYEGILLQKYEKSTPASATFDVAMDSFMTIYQDVNGNLYIGDGNANVFQITKDSQNRILFTNSQNTYYASFKSGLNGTDYSQIFYGPSGNETAYCFKLATFYETAVKNVIIGGISYAKEDIVGHKAVVKYKNEEREIYMFVPVLPSGGDYDVRLVNPDNDMAIREDGFKYWNVEGDSPVITQLDPDFGSVDGGYYVIIKGKNFEKNILGQSKVIIANVEVPEKDVQISADRTEIMFKMPKYDKDLKEIFGVSKITVPLIVSNSKGKSAYLENGFTLVQAEDRPRVEKLIKNTGSPIGGEEVRVVGVDFKLREYGTDLNGNGTTNDDYSGVDFSKLEEIHPNWSKEQIETYKLEASKILPKVYFGSVKVDFEDAIQYTESEIRLYAPEGKAGQVPVYVINYDSAISNQNVLYTYVASKVSITDFTPTQGDKIGGKLLEVKGTEFAQGEVKLYQNGSWQTVTMPLIRFGNITNETEETSGLLTNSLATVDFEKDAEFSDMDIKANGLRVIYNANPNAKTLTIRLTEADQVFEKVIPNYGGEEAFVDLRDVVGDALSEVNYDFMRVVLEEGDSGYRLVVERGFSPKTKFFNESSISLYTPMYYTIGAVPLTYYNPDGQRGVSQKQFTYINPPIRPVIEDIIDVEKIPANTPEKGNYYKIGPIGNVGRNFTIIGSGFAEGIKVRIGGVDAESFEIINENKIKVKAPEKPAGIEYEEELLITIEGERIDSATSADDNLRESGKGPIYFFYRKGSTDTPPVILGVDPIRIVINQDGRLKIFGNYFRTDNGSVRVRIDGEIVPVISVTTTEIVVQAPVREVPGLVNIYIENRDVLGRTAGVVENETLFGYASDPQIEEITPDKVSILGGDIILIKGSGFLEDAVVLIGDKDAEILSLTEEEIKVKTPEHTLGKKDVEVRNTDYVADTDFGRFILKEGVEYVIPRPELPTYFVALPGHERSVTLKWNEVEDALRYKLYIKGPNDQTFVYLGETDGLQYLVKNLQSDTWYQFGLKPVTQFGDSENMAFAACKTLTKEEDKEPEIPQADAVPVTLKWQEGGIYKIQLADSYSPSNYVVDIQRESPNIVEIRVPLKAILEKRGTGVVTAKDWEVKVSLYEISKQFPNLKEAPKDAFVSLKIENINSQRKTSIQNITGKKLYGPVFRIQASYLLEKENRQMKLNQFVQWTVYSESKDGYFISRFDPATKKLMNYTTYADKIFKPLTGKYVYSYTATLPQSGEYSLGMK